MPYMMKKISSRVKNGGGGANDMQLSLIIPKVMDRATPSSRRSRHSRNDKELTHAQKLEELKANLYKSREEQLEDKEAEIRYAHFIMLQSLGKRMKKFYKYDYYKSENRVQNFRKASELIKQVNQKTVTPSV